MSGAIELAVRVFVVFIIGGILGKYVAPNVGELLSRVRNKKEGQEKEKEHIRYHLCLSCLQGYVEVPRGCKDCGGDRFLEVSPTGIINDIGEQKPKKIIFGGDLSG